MRVIRVYHAGRDSAHRARERALAAAGVEVTLVVPRRWPEARGGSTAEPAPIRIVELDVKREGDVNRHSYRDPDVLRDLIHAIAPDVVDLHEEPFSVSARQWLAAAPPKLPVVMYTAQNVDKRLPPPFFAYERRAHRRVFALYPCSRQAAAVARGKGFDGLIEVIPLGFDPGLFSAGEQSPDDAQVTLALFGRLVREKGVLDAVRVLAAVNVERPARLVLVGSGPAEQQARELARALNVSDRLEVLPWAPSDTIATLCRQAHVVLVPSVPTETWTEQFGRVIVEAQASGAVVAGYASGAIAEVGGAAALIVAPHDAAGLAAAVGAVLGDHADFARRREMGRALSRERTWEQVAGRQLDLYVRAAGGEALRPALPRSPRERRALAHAEWGPTAPTTAGLRPFALPWLRRGGSASSALGRLVDLAAETKARLRLPIQRGVRIAR